MKKNRLQTSILALLLASYAFVPQSANPVVVIVE